jgi:MOSC domain-containing protein YiiM
MDHHPHQNASRRLPMSTSARTRRAETQVMRLLSVNVGLPREVSWRGRAVSTAIFKSPVTGRRQVALNVDGDGQADLVGHGGEHRAVYVYDISAYEYWSDVLGRDDLVPGHFGENFTVEGMPDDESA